LLKAAFEELWYHKSLEWLFCKKECFSNSIGRAPIGLKKSLLFHLVALKELVLVLQKHWQLLVLMLFGIGLKLHITSSKGCRSIKDSEKAVVR